MGYLQDYSMSERAAYAYNKGLLPASKISAELKIPTKLIKEFCTVEEWHHTSSRYNETLFFDKKCVSTIFGIKTLCDCCEPNDKAIKALNTKSDVDIKELGRCVIRYEEWSGSKRYGSFIDYEVEVENATLKGDWIMFNGQRKNVTGNHFKSYEVIEQEQN